MRLFDLLMAMEKDTLVAIQLLTDDEPMFPIKAADAYTLAEIGYFNVISFYPEHYHAFHETGITVIVKES